MRAAIPEAAPGGAGAWIGRSLRVARRAASYLRQRPARIRFGSFRRLQPVSRSFGIDRGWPVDRYYIESFLDRYRLDVRGRVLEAGGLVNYTRDFGGSRVTRADVIYPEEGHADATIVGDLASGRNIPDQAFDCMILTQVFPFIYDLQAAVRQVHRALKPGGVVLATLPGISQICRYDNQRWGDYWRFTGWSAQRLFADVFGERNVSIGTHGNVLAATAFLQGLAIQDLTLAELDHHDPEYPLSITVRAIKLPWKR